MRRAAEPVSVAAKSEMLTLFLPGGGGGSLLRQPLVVVEAVTSRVSVLPVVGSDLLAGLSVAAGGTDQLFLGSGDILDKVGHGAGQSGVCIVPVERLSKLREVRDIVFFWMRQWPFSPVSFSCRMKGKMRKCPYTLMMAERHYNGQWTSSMKITTLR